MQSTLEEKLSKIIRGNGNDLLEYDMSLSVSQDAINHQLEWIAYQNEFRSYEWHVKLNKNDNPNLDVKGMGAPYIRFVESLDAQKVQIVMHLPILNGTFTYFNLSKSQEQGSFVYDNISLKGYEILLTTNLRRIPDKEVDADKLKINTIDSPLQKFREENLSIEHLFVDLTNAKLATALQIDYQKNIPPALKKLLDEQYEVEKQFKQMLEKYVSLLAESENPYVLGHIVTEVTEDVVSATSDQTTFPPTDCNFTITKNHVAPQLSSLNYLMVTGAKKLPVSKTAGVSINPIIKTNPKNKQTPQCTFLLSEELTFSSVAKGIAKYFNLTNEQLTPKLEAQGKVSYTFRYDMPVYKTDKHGTLKLDNAGNKIWDKNQSGTMYISLTPKIGRSNLKVNTASPDTPDKKELKDVSGAAFTIDYTFITDDITLKYGAIVDRRLQVKTTWTTELGFALVNGATGKIAFSEPVTSNPSHEKINERTYPGAIAGKIFSWIIPPLGIGLTIGEEVNRSMQSNLESRLGQGVASFNFGWNSRIILPGIKIIEYAALRFTAEGHLALDAIYTQ
ncbi:hypothetical protein [Microscilla marina]|uniref:Uncharacterized protein n=1 Tax=Microscilla marina ATCC 23134 TaxID=313606 RepID=A1ZMC2_MICM2|nr:hypothetical protein [Microscilla marina]EAY28302.1 hypothetical protein M23134_03854 [Microscilla marina ATCC 23134]